MSRPFLILGGLAQLQEEGMQGPNYPVRGEYP
jgi:hypothetical protein